MAQAPKKWNEVVQSEGYQALNSEQKSAAQQQYFNEVVAPRVPEAERNAALQQFVEQNPPALVVEQRNTQARQQLIQMAQQADAERRATNKANRPEVSTTDILNGNAPPKRDSIDELLEIKGRLDTAFGNARPQTATANINPNSGFFFPAAGRYREGDQSNNESIGDGVAQGATLSLGDELVGALESAVTDRTYEEVRDEVRANNAESAAANPNLYLTGELIGGVATGSGVAGAVGRGAQALNAGSRATTAAQIAAGTAEGVVGGVGASDAELGSEESNDAALLGGAFGTVGAAAGEGLSRLGSKVMDSALVNQNAGRRSIQRTLQEVQADRNLTDEEMVDYVGGQLDEAAGSAGRGTSTNSGAMLADVDELGDLARGANQEVQIDQGIRNRIAGRQRQLEQNFVEQADPTQTVGGTTPAVVGGRQIGRDELIQNSGTASATDTGTDSGLVNLNAYSDAARKEGNTQAADLYEAAYSRQPSETDILALEEVMGQSPLLQRAFSQGTANARDINLANGNVDVDPSFVQVMDETSKALGSMLKQTEVGQSRAAITGLKSQLDESIAVIAPELSQARQAAGEGQRAKGFVEGGKEAVDSQSIDAVDDFVRSYELGTPAAQQAALGAGRAIREATFNHISRGTRDNATKKLLTTRQIEQYNRVMDKTPDRDVVNQLLDADARAFRTKELSEVNRRTWQQELKSALLTAANAVAAGAGVVALATMPTAVGLAIAAGRVGHVAASTMNQKQLARQIQRELYSFMPDVSSSARKEYVENILKGDFGNVPSKQLEAVGLGLSKALTAQSAQENIEQQE